MREISERVRAATREHERLFHELVAGELRFRRLAKAVWKVQEEERRRLARELHDGLGQTLTALKNELELLAQSAEGPELRVRLEGAAAVAAGALAETRQLSRLLRPPILDDLGLAAALRWLARSLRERAGLEVEVELAGVERRLDPEIETLLFRVAQEALTNVLKHSGVARAALRLSVAEGHARLRVADAGRGFDPDSLRAAEPVPAPVDLEATGVGASLGRAGIGLRGVRDRVELFGGAVELHAAPGRGTVLELSVPLGER